MASWSNPIEERRTSDLVCRTALASRNHNEQLHDGVVDLGAARLDDKDILLSHAGENPDAGLAIGKLGELGVSWSHPQVRTYFAREGWARTAREDQGAAHGCDFGWGGRKKKGLLDEERNFVGEKAREFFNPFPQTGGGGGLKWGGLEIEGKRSEQVARLRGSPVPRVLCALVQGQESGSVCLQWVVGRGMPVKRAAQGVWILCLGAVRTDGAASNKIFDTAATHIISQICSIYPSTLTTSSSTVSITLNSYLISYINKGNGDPSSQEDSRTLCGKDEDFGL